MNQYKPYPKYKDSGIVWIESVPEHWKVSRLKFLISQCQNGVWGDDPLEDGTDTLCIRVADFDRENLKVIDRPSTYRQINSEHRESRLVSKGDILLEKSGGGEKTLVGANVQYLGNENAVCSNFVAVIKPSEKVNASWLNYLMSAMYSRKINLKSIKQATGIQNLDSEQYLDEAIAYPPKEEQNKISDAISREISRIDTLITKKTHFIDLLKEKRQALITHAVTKGLNSKVKMKDSGVEWIGEVPEHWEIISGNRLFSESKQLAFENDQHLSATQKYGVIPLEEFQELEGRRVTQAVKNLEKRKHARINDFVISMRSFQGGIERVKANGCVRSSYVVLKPTPASHVGYFTYLFKSITYIQGLQATSMFIRDGQDLSYNNFRQVKVPCPSVSEQTQIADFLDKAIKSIDMLITKTQKSIDLLKERRSAFITAAVTGQIDLRGE
ncbi:type I restriction enzyme, S subunit [Paenibacillus sp. ov031]|uniref:restriction endonuclease subunit S n=1 Tax=Paenibacillus sp. ov031 TaxID=1761879 RepID=UPI00091CEAD6|nr:restriction endonuclease subunit S [Paenibacillus sp. ov031]SHN80824.1 type I restriction enzyme, S subunit [Paenibacillus sp. ov031]